MEFESKSMQKRVTISRGVRPLYVIAAYARDLMMRWTAVRQWRVKRVPREPLTVLAEINLTGGITYYKVKITRESIGAACSRLTKQFRGVYTDILVRDCLRYLTEQDTFYSRIRNGNL